MTKQSNSPVVVESAVTLSKEELDSLESYVKEQKIGTSVINQVNPSLLGGLRLAYQGKVVDLSLKYRLEELAQKLRYEG